MTLGQLLQLLIDNFLLLVIRQKGIEDRLKRLEEQVRALREQRPE